MPLCIYDTVSHTRKFSWGNIVRLVDHTTTRRQRWRQQGCNFGFNPAYLLLHTRVNPSFKSLTPGQWINRTSSSYSVPQGSVYTYLAYHFFAVLRSRAWAHLPLRSTWRWERRSVWKGRYSLAIVSDPRHSEQN